MYLLIACILSVSIRANGETWGHNKVLDDGHFHVHWKLKNDMIVFQIEVECKGYVGFGLSRDGKMKGSDIVTGWINDGQVYFHDRHGVGNVVPELDEQQDWHLLQATENETHNVFKFYRKLQTCDEDDLEIDESTFEILYAYSDKDPVTFHDMSYHFSNRGHKGVRLLTLSPLSYGTSVEGLPYWKVRGDYHITPEVKSIYWCRVIKSPNFGAKQHVVKAEVVIQPGNEQLIHHMNIIHCQGLEPILETNIEFACHDSKVNGIRKKKCREYGLSYVIGSEDIIFPGNAAYPVMPNEYYIFETHYDNALGVDIRDHTGFNLYYTPELRKFDIGRMGMGIVAIPTFVIPPQTENFTLAGHTNFKHFGSAFPKDGIRVIALNLHAHMTAKRLIVRHFRNQTELKPILEDNYYNFSLQNIDLLLNEVHISPDDQMTVECTYSTMDRNTPTFGGSSTAYEMCEAVFYYYPSIKEHLCFSKITMDAVQKLDFISEEGNTFRKGSLQEDLKHLDWTKINIPIFNNVLRYSPQTSCAKTLNNSNPEFEFINYPEGYTPYEKPKSSCKKVSIQDLEPSSGIQTKNKLEFLFIASLIALLNF